MHILGLLRMLHDASAVFGPGGLKQTKHSRPWKDLEKAIYKGWWSKVKTSALGTICLAFTRMLVQFTIRYWYDY